MTPRAAIREAFEEIAPGSSKKAQREAERKLLMALAVAFVADGYTLALAAESLGVPKTTLDGWRRKHPGFAAELATSREHTRKWLLGKLTTALDKDLRWAGRAANILANLWFDELRSSKVEATVTSTPDAGSSRSAILGAVNKSRPLTH